MTQRNKLLGGGLFVVVAAQLSFGISVIIKTRKYPSKFPDRFLVRADLYGL